MRSGQVDHCPGIGRSVAFSGSCRSGHPQLESENAKAVGLDPNQWFGNIEIIAAHDIGRETVDYVSNIYKYYTAYKAIAAQHAAQTPPAG